MSHTIQKILSRKGSSRLEHFMLLSLMILLQQTLRSFSSAETCFSSTGHESPVAARAFHKASLVLAGLSDKRDFYRTPLSSRFSSYMRSAQGTGRIRGSDNNTSCSKMNSDNLPTNTQIFIFQLSVSSWTWMQLQLSPLAYCPWIIILYIIHNLTFICSKLKWPLLLGDNK